MQLAPKQTDRVLSIATPLEKDDLLLETFKGEDGLSRLFHYQLDLLSMKPDIAFDKILGQSVTITLTSTPGSVSTFHGMVKRFAQGNVEFGMNDQTYYRYH